MMNESYSMVCMCAFINATELTFGSLCETVNSALTVIFILLCTVLPPITAVFLYRQLPFLGEVTMKRKFGDLTEGLDLS
jgi:hypothetical protein